MGCAASIRETLTKNSLIVDRNHFYFAKVIGSGGFGTVFSAMHVDYHSWFAVKQINKLDLMKHKSGLDMIMGELNAWKKVEHHHYISDLHFAFQDRAYCYFVMDLLTGADLRYYVKKRLILTEPELAFLVACMASALNHLHSRGILHRDIKPENVVFDHEGFPYLTDFGVSHICGEDMTCSLSSGTKQYLAPEVFGKTHIHGPGSDFWSLGVMIYEVMYGKRPFDKHVPREFISHVEFEIEQEMRRSKGSATPIRGNSPRTDGSVSPFNTTRGLSPVDGDTGAMSGAISLANTKTPPPAIRRLTPEQSLSERTFSLRLTTPRSTVAEYGAQIKKDTDPLKLPEVFPSSSKKKAPLKKSQLTSMGSLAVASSLVEMLRREEETRHFQPPGASASKYALPRSVQSSKGPDEVTLFEVPDVDSAGLSINYRIQVTAGPETDGPLRGSRPEIDVSQFTETEESMRAISCGASQAPILPNSLKITLPFTSMCHEQVSLQFLSFLEGILDIRPKYRLGGLNNYAQLQSHPWFSQSDLSWPDIEEKKAIPPFVPNREQIQFDMQSKHQGIDIDELDSVRQRDFLALHQQKQFDDYHHIAKEYKDLFPNLRVHKAAPGVIPLKCKF